VEINTTAFTDVRLCSWYMETDVSEDHYNVFKVRDGEGRFLPIFGTCFSDYTLSRS
jgi:hypothetical protein